MWAAAKLWRRTHGYKSKDALQEYLHEFCYRYNHGKSFDYIWKNGTLLHNEIFSMVCLKKWSGDSISSDFLY